MSILFIDATTKVPADSRTHQLATAFLDAFGVQTGEPITHLDLKVENLSPLTAADTTLREQVIKDGDMAHPLAKYALQFSQADHIVLAAPYWDLSFPAMVKIYMEYLCACGITFAYGAEGIIPMCQAKTFTYITTCGGEIYPSTNMGYDYLATVCKAMFGIQNTRCLTAQNLDIQGADVDAILAEAKAEAVTLAEQG